MALYSLWNSLLLVIMTIVSSYVHEHLIRLFDDTTCLHVPISRSIDMKLQEDGCGIQHRA